MRITNAMMVSSYLNNLNKSSNAMNKMQIQIASGKRFSRASEDPIAAGKAMGVRANLSRLSQYTTNVVEAQEWLNQSESSLNELNALFSRAYELANNAANGANGETERRAIADEIEQIGQQLVVSANSTFNSKYIFGGLNTMQAPFEIKEVAGENILFYNGINLNEITPEDLAKLKGEHVNYEIGYGATMDISYNGLEVVGWGEENAFAVLNGLVKALRSGDVDGIQSAVGQTKSKQEDIVVALGGIGGKTNRLEIFKTRLGNDEFSYKTIQENTEGISTEETIMRLKMEGAVYEAALAMGSRIIQSSLADFLR